MSHAVVYHMEGYSPEQLIYFQKHHNRTHGDLEHCAPDRFKQNRVIHGNRETWATDFVAEVEAYKELNMRNEVAALYARGRPTEAKRRHTRGGIDPWKKSSELGVARSILLSAHDDFFKQKGFEDFEGADFRDPEICAAFEELAETFVEEKIPKKYWLFAVWEYDEKSPHLHLYARAWNTKETKTKGVQRMLQPTDIVHFRNAEKAQDEIGEWFESIGLRRGKKTAKARREARAKGEMPPDKARRLEPWQWRQQQRMGLIEAEKKSVAAADLEEKKREEAEAERESARKEREALSLAIIAEDRRREREEGEHLSRLKKADEEAAERRRLADTERTARIAEEDRQRSERDKKLDAKAAEVERKTGLLVSALREFENLGEAVKTAARKVGLVDHPLVQTSVRAIAKMREMIGNLGGDQRQR